MARDGSLAEQVAAARRARTAAEEALEGISERIGAEQRSLSAAQQRAASARSDAAEAERQLRDITRRVQALSRDQRLLDVVGDAFTDLWTGRTALTDALQQRSASADTDVADARAAVGAAKRTVEAVGADGLLPASQVAEGVARRCQDADVPAWPGWRWLADTMAPPAAAAFAAARPEIASGVVVAHPDLVERAVDAVGAVDIDVAVWIGAVVDTEAASARNADDGDAGTRAHVLLPHAGIYDRDAASRLVSTAEAALEAATQRLHAAARRGTNARDMLAALSRLWTDLPDDPLDQLTEKVGAARSRQHDAESEAQAAVGRLADLDRQQGARKRDRHAAQETIDDATETRRLLVPVIAAARAHERARQQLPGRLGTVSDTKRRVDALRRRKPELADEVAAAEDLVRHHTRRRDDAAELLRVAGLCPRRSTALCRPRTRGRSARVSPVSRKRSRTRPWILNCMSRCNGPAGTCRT
jgi:hypothetical protein